MPTYVYGGPCGCKLEVTHGINEEPEVRCEKCDRPMVRQMQPMIITFNSGGFYSTDKNKK